MASFSSRRPTALRRLHAIDCVVSGRAGGAKFAAKFGDFRVDDAVRRLILAVGIEQPNLVARRVLGWRRGGRGPQFASPSNAKRVEAPPEVRGRGHRRRRGRGDRRRRGFRRLPAFVAFVAILHRFHRVRVRDESRACRRAVRAFVVLVDERHRLGHGCGDATSAFGAENTTAHAAKHADTTPATVTTATEHPHRAREDVRADDAERGARGDTYAPHAAAPTKKTFDLFLRSTSLPRASCGVSSDELGARRQLRHRRLRLRLVESVVIAAESSHLGEKFFVRVAGLRLVAERGGPCRSAASRAAAMPVRNEGLPRV